ncbi:transcriptional regulator [Pseudonocardia sp. NPDC049154]|uniref:transcriptional regulator n=1 Tax=Pseudonocardia sp. NPDC049154 TaxID=3155501 RepID=UPI0033C8522C
MDDRATVLWTDGDPSLRRETARAGFVEGVRWDEQSVGTNAIGLALRTGSATTLLGPEHFELCQRDWFCVAVPVPGPTAGVVNIAGPLAEFHPRTQTLAASLAALVASETRAHRFERLERLRMRYAGHLGDRDLLLVDDEGWVVPSSGPSRGVGARIPAPTAGAVLVPGHGRCPAEPVAGGWLVRLRPRTARTPVTARLRLDRGTPCLVVDEAPDPLELTRRQGELLLLLHLAGTSGLWASDVARVLHGGGSPTVSVRAEVSRLRRALGTHASLVDSRPYRIRAGYHLDPGPDWRDSPFVRGSRVAAIRSAPAQPTASDTREDQNDDR